MLQRFLNIALSNRGILQQQQRWITFRLTKLAHNFSTVPSIYVSDYFHSSCRKELWNHRTPFNNVQSYRTLFVQTESTPNPNSMMFRPGLRVMQSGTVEFTDNESAKRSPLAHVLFKIPGICGVFFGNDFITVSKSTDVEWPLLKPEIFAAIMDFFATDQPILHEAVSENNSQSEDTEIVKMIKELLDTRIRPSIQEDGGDVVFKGYDAYSGVVKLKLQGSCTSCPSSVVTLKNGIENMLMHYVPEVQGVESVKDEIDKVSDQELTKLEKSIHNKSHS